MPSIPSIEDKLTVRYNSLVNAIAEGKTPSLDPEITRIYSELYNQDIEIGYGSKWAKSKPGSLQFQRLAKMRANALYFAASKQSRIIEDLQIIKEGTEPETFAQLANGYYHTQNRSWLQAEREMIQANAQMAKRWHDIQLVKEDLPNLTYDTVGDDRVRPEHQVLNGITKPVDDEFWKTHYPPIGFRCRCDVQQNSRKVTPDSSLPQKNVVSKAYAFNSGIENRVAGVEHPFLKAAFVTKEIQSAMMLHCKYSEVATTFFKSGNAKLSVSSSINWLTEAKKAEGLKEVFVEEYNVAKVLVKSGKNVKMLPFHHYDVEDIFNPDYEVDGVIYDLKTTITQNYKRGISNAISKALKQEVYNIVLDCSSFKESDMSSALKTITKRLNKEGNTIENIIIIRNGKIIEMQKGS